MELPLSGFCRCGKPSSLRSCEPIRNREQCRLADHPLFDWSRTDEDPCPSILEICEALHCSHTGSADPLQDDEKARLRRILISRLLFWHTSPAFVASYDEAVKGLILAVLQETAPR